MNGSGEEYGGSEVGYGPSIRIRYVAMFLAIIMSLRIGEAEALAKDTIIGLARPIGW